MEVDNTMEVVVPEIKIFDVIHPNVNRTNIPEHIMTVGKRLKSSIKFAKKCANNILYTKLDGHPNMQTCGYTAPVIAICFRLLNLNNIDTVKEYFERMSIHESLKEAYITRGVNQAAGYLWNHHTHLNAGIDYLYHNSPHLFTENLLNYGENIVSFFNNPEHGLSIHHSFIYYDPTYCIIVDSWAEDKCRRNPSIRLYNTEDVIQTFNRINQIGSESVAELNEMMYDFFLASNSKSYNKLYVRVLNQDFWIKVTNKGLGEGFVNNLSWGVKKTKKSKKKSKKSKTRIKQKVKRV
jgi:hypothetical protein